MSTCCKLRESGCTQLRMNSSNGEKTVTKMHGIKSLPTPGYRLERECPQEGDQDPHADESLDNISRYMRGREACDMPCSVIIAIMPGSCLRICRLDTHEWVIVHLEPGDVLVFRGDVCHNGLGYDVENVRVHAYLYPPDYKPGASHIDPCHTKA